MKKKPSKLKQLKEYIKNTSIIKHILLALCILLIAIIAINILLNVMTRHGQVYQVPDFSGMSIEQAEQAGAQAKLRISINDSLYVADMPGGVILEQNPTHGTMVKSNRHIFVTTNSFNQRLVDIPYITGYSLRQAKNNLEVAGLSIEKLIYTDDIATNNVIAQRYNNIVIEEDSKIQAPKGAGITLVVGRNDPNIQQAVPMLVGLSLAQAKSMLWESGFNVSRIKYDEDITDGNSSSATVTYQMPFAGNLETLGNNISLSVSFDQNKIKEGVDAAHKEYKRMIAEKDSLLRVADSLRMLDSLSLEIFDFENPLQYNE